MNKILIALLGLGLTTAVMAFDTTKANELNKFYSHATHKALAHSKTFIKGDAVMKMYKDGKDFTILDVRTDGEASVVALSAKNALHIPLSKLFLKQNLEKLPLKKPIVLVCHSGTRATMAMVGLKELGFKNVHVLKGGLIGLATADNPKNAPLQ
ncbi:rhodanese-like domain-containing protein [Sulfurimonas sp.]|uniref:rhodanese-like domain-containing protein n=1 Tax=Sulfurimonas sp. TaxID=2022749 RepID=UPI00260FC7CA|nr:rhodanese-like domain-containing protein [Sulfurimonas sp.]